MFASSLFYLGVNEVCVLYVFPLETACGLLAIRLLQPTLAEIFRKEHSTNDRKLQPAEQKTDAPYVPAYVLQVDVKGDKQRYRESAEACRPQQYRHDIPILKRQL
jgi:hypothetical protein